MFRRKLFFLLERLKITPAERKTVTVLIVILAILGLLNVAWTPSAPFAGGYEELEQAFLKRTEMLEKQNRLLMERYEPDAGMEMDIVRTSADTVTGDSSKATVRPADALPSEEKININTASAEKLQELPGIGPAYSARIVRYREKHGKFGSLDELIKIKGIGKKRLDKLLPFVKLTDSE